MQRCQAAGERWDGVCWSCHYPQPCSGVTQGPKPKAKGPAAFSTRLKLVALRQVVPCHGFKSTSHAKQNNMWCHWEATEPGTCKSLFLP